MSDMSRESGRTPADEQATAEFSERIIEILEKQFDNGSVADPDSRMRMSADEFITAYGNPDAITPVTLKKQPHSRLREAVSIGTSLAMPIGFLVVGYALGKRDGQYDPEPEPEFPALFSEQHVIPVSDVNPGIAAAATVQVRLMCNLYGEGMELTSQGTGGLYETPDGLQIGTVSHVAVAGYGTAASTAKEPLCEHSFKIQTAAEQAITFTLPTDAFKPSYTRVEDLRAVNDQPALARVPVTALEDIQAAIYTKDLTPLEIGEPTDSSWVIVRQHNTSEPFTIGGEIAGTHVDLTETSTLRISYDAVEGTNICSGNSGSPILAENADGSVSNHAFAVMSTTVGPNSPCGVEGDFSGFEQPLK